MPSKLFKDVSASALQVVINQSLGAAVFLITSFYLPKESYGELNWSIAIFTFFNNLLSFRLEQIVVKKAATATDSSTIMTLFMFHVLLTGIGFYILLLLLHFAFPDFFSVHDLLLIVGISQLFNFFSSPFKQVANGKERFDHLALMSSVNNAIRVILLLGLIFFSAITINNVLIVFIIGSAIEFLVSFLLTRFRMKIPFQKGFRFRDYALLLKEALPQMGAAILMAGITRLDWIFLGVFSTTIVTAEYSFAYRVYELSPFPLLIIGPVLLSRFSKYFANDPQRSLMERKEQLNLLVRMEMIAATLIPLVLNIIWSPVMDALSGNKYGKVNEWIFFILSLCIPFQYISNIIWSARFAQHRLKLILKITVITFLIILIGDLVFIPLYGGLGAAIVYLTAIIAEYLNFMRNSEIAKIKASWLSLGVCMIAAVGSGFVAIYFFEDTIWRVLSAIGLYLILLVATRQLRINDLQFIRRFISNKKVEQ